MCIDYEKAFDRVKHENIIECMKNLDIDWRDISLIRNLYRNQKAYMRIEDGLSPEIHIKGRVRQGCAVCYHPICLICTQKTYLEQLIPTKAHVLVEQQPIMCAMLLYCSTG